MANKKTIERHVISYFAWRFDRPPSDFSRATEVRKAFKNDQAWMALADTFNDMAWMKQLGIMLQQKAMAEVSTIGELTDLIASKAGQNIALLSGAEFKGNKGLDWSAVA